MTDEEINAVWYMCTMGYYLALKRKDILTTWMNLEDSMLSEISQS